MNHSGILNQNVVVACRLERIQSDPAFFQDVFGSYEWVLLDGFGESELRAYLGPEIVDWLDYSNLPEDFRNLLCVPFYANAARRIGLKPEDERNRIDNRGRLLLELEVEIFREARHGRAPYRDYQESKIKDLLYRLSFGTLAEGHKQAFPRTFLHPYEDECPKECEIVFRTDWVFYSRSVFEGKSEEHCTFYHQLLQEFFAARKLEQLFSDNREGFDEAMMELEFSTVVLDLLDDLLPHETVYNHCMDRFESALEWADRNKKGISDAGHKFTWLLALRDRKGKKPDLKERLQGIFDEEKRNSQNTEIDGKFVRIPDGAFLMGSYEDFFEKPVRIVYVPEYWISKYTETFREYDVYCQVTGEKEPDDENWGRESRPVINVSWEMAKLYAEWCGPGYALPSEAQWEKASRGRLGRRYPWGNGEPDESLCHFEQDWETGGTVDAQALPSQMYGIYQMAGNVWEWTEDDRHESYRDTPDDGGAWVDTPRGGIRVIRGGSWDNDARDCRSAFRYGNLPGSRIHNLGFRLSRSVALGPLSLEPLAEGSERSGGNE